MNRPEIMLTHDIVKRIFVVVAVIFAVTWLSACGGKTVLPGPTSTIPPEPSATFSPQPSSTFTQTATSTATLLPSTTPTPIPPTLTSTPTPLAERLPIIEYHYSDFRLSDQVMMKLEWFTDQLRWLADNHFTTLSAEDLVRFLDGGNFPMRSVVLTFDLGTAQRSDFANVIVPALKEHGFKAIFFLLVNDSVVRDQCGLKENTFCWKELKQWQDDGVVSFGSHGLYHPDYTKLSADEIRYDAGQSKKLIEKQLGQPVLGFTYPYDSTNKTAIAVVRSLGYQFATSGNSRPDRSVYRLDQNRFELPRLYPYSNPSLYPVISGSNGKTFDQLILSSLEQRTSVVGEASDTPAATPADKNAGYIDFCHANPRPNGDDWAYRLDAHAFVPDINPAVQEQLPKGIIVRPSCNFAAGNTPRAIVIHYTDWATLEGAVATLRSAYGTSAHYIIDRDGAVVQMVPEKLVAFHASCYGYRSGCIPSCPICDGLDGRLVEPYTQSIGIELVNDGYVSPDSFKGPIYEDYQNSLGQRYWEDYTKAQVDALLFNVIQSRDGYYFEVTDGGAVHSCYIGIDVPGLIWAQPDEIEEILPDDLLASRRSKPINITMLPENKPALALFQPVDETTAPVQEKIESRLPLLLLIRQKDGHIFALRDLLSIGRGKENNLVLQDNGISRKHAVIEPTSAGWLIRDLNSTNGTWLNGVRITNAVILKAGDRLEFGKTILRLELSASERF